MELASSERTTAGSTTTTAAICSSIWDPALRRRVDWLELALDISSDVSPRLVVDAAMEVLADASPTTTCIPFAKQSRTFPPPMSWLRLRAATTLMKSWLRNGPRP